MPNKALTFKTDILPYSDRNFNLGNLSVKWKVNGYVVSSASEKNVDVSVVAGSDNLPTSAAVISFVEGKGYINSTTKGQPNGVAELDSVGKIPASCLPSYVDQVIEYSTRDNFPLTGSDGVIYVATDTGYIYRWGGSDYVDISALSQHIDIASIQEIMNYLTIE